MEAARMKNQLGNMRKHQKLGLKSWRDVEKMTRINADFSGKGNYPVKTGIMRGARGKDHKQFEWSVLPRYFLPGLSIVVQNGN